MTSVNPATDRTGPPVLAAKDVEFSYGSSQVLFGVSLAVQPGEVLALLGTNGAGKSTLLRVLTGLARPWAGSVWLDGADITAVPAERRVRSGVVHVPGGKALFPGLTVAENLVVGAYTYIRDKQRVAERRERVFALFPKLADRLHRRAGSLSGGEQQMLAIAKGLLLDPRLLCIDELSLGLAPTVVQELLAVVGNLQNDGVSMIIVEQSLNVALALSDRAVFMEKGAVRFEGSAAELRDRDDLARAVFLGDRAR